MQPTIMSAWLKLELGKDLEMVNSHPIVMRAPDSIRGGVVAAVSVSQLEEGQNEAVARLLPAEAELARELSTARRAPFVAGRLALRAALHALDPALATEPLLRTARGGPRVPAGVTGSISHKQSRAIAIVAPSSVAPSSVASSSVASWGDNRAGGDTHVGIDIEHRPAENDTRNAKTTTRALARRILTAHEIDALDDRSTQNATPRSLRERVLLLFALKEAVYKSIDPMVNRHVRFTEVEVEVELQTELESDVAITTQLQTPTASLRARREGTALVKLLLPELTHSAVNVKAAWWIDDDWIVAAAIGSNDVPWSQLSV